GILTPEQCQASMKLLQEYFEAEPIENAAPDHDFRVVMGLREGYGTNKKLHQFNEVERLIGDVVVQKAGIYCVTPGVPFKVHDESAAVIYGSLDELPDVYALAELIKQQRFCVEDFSAGQAYIVETPLCEEPDLKEIPATSSNDG